MTNPTELEAAMKWADEESSICYGGTGHSDAKVLAAEVRRLTARMAALTGDLESKECLATPCDIIRARNDERERACEIIGFYVMDKEANKLCLDALHGIYGAALKPKETIG